MPGEFDLIDWIRAQHPPTGRVPVPQGDDLAVVRWDAEDLLLVGVDQGLDGVHFDSAVHPPRRIGKKVMNRNLSDCAAMACLPVAAVTTVALPKGTAIEYARELYLGLREAADPFDCAIVGGDTATWAGKLLLTVTILGKSGGVAPVTRAGARPGDGIYVTGPLGGSILGRHLDFVPRVREARELAATGLVTAMIDLSDGLSRDLRHITSQSRSGASLTSSTVPIHDDARRLSETSGRSPLEHALHDGEDHELLFTARGTPPTGVRIGTITAGSEVRDEEGRVELTVRGWEHRL